MLAAAKRLFVDRGFGGTSLRDIAAEAGYTQGAFYSNFASKEELFVELMRERSQTQVADIARVLSDPDASGEDILTALEVWSRTVDAGPSGRCWVSSSSFRGGATPLLPSRRRHCWTPTAMASPTASSRFSRG